MDARQSQDEEQEEVRAEPAQPRLAGDVGEPREVEAAIPDSEQPQRGDEQRHGRRVGEHADEVGGVVGRRAAARKFRRQPVDICDCLGPVAVRDGGVVGHMSVAAPLRPDSPTPAARACRR